MERTVEIVDGLKEASASERAYWRTQTPERRLQHALELRRMNYGTDRISARLQRVLEIIDRPRG